MSEIIPIPNRRARDRRPIHLEFTPRAFPGQRFALRLDWNDYLEKWILELEHLEREYTISTGAATPYRPYEYLPFLVFLFADPSGTATEITPGNLGDEIQFYVLPGPSGRVDENEGE